MTRLNSSSRTVLGTSLWIYSRNGRTISDGQHRPPTNSILLSLRLLHPIRLGLHQPRVPQNLPTPLLLPHDLRLHREGRIHPPSLRLGVPQCHSRFRNPPCQWSSVRRCSAGNRPALTYPYQRLGP